MVLKGGQIAYAQVGDANASIPTPQPYLPRPVWGSTGRAPASNSFNFVPPAGRPLNRRHPDTATRPTQALGLGLNKKFIEITAPGGSSKADMKQNDTVPRPRIDPDSFEVTIGGATTTRRAAPNSTARPSTAHLRHRTPHGPAVLPLLIRTCPAADPRPRPGPGRADAPAGHRVTIRPCERQPLAHEPRRAARPGRRPLPRRRARPLRRRRGRRRREAASTTPTAWRRSAADGCTPRAWSRRRWPPRPPPDTTRCRWTTPPTPAPPSRRCGPSPASSAGR